MKLLRIKIIVSIVIVAIVGVFFSFRISKKNDIPIVYMSSSYANDPYDLNVKFGCEDYVFVGKIEDQLKTDIYQGCPYTNYKVSVIENIKNTLTQKESILILKTGGLIKDKYLIMEGDFLPEIGDNYIFCASTRSDGTLLLTGPNSNIPIESEKDDLSININRGNEGFSTQNSILSEKEVQKYKNALDNQIEWKQENFICKYDVSK